MDYFDFIKPSNNGLGVIATGISGVGVGSAIYSVILGSAFHSCMAEAHSTFTVMRSLNNVLYEYSGGKGKFVTAYYYYYDVESRRLMYTNAGFSPLEIFGIERGDFNSCDTEGIPLGYEKGTTFGMGRISLIRGDIGVLYSRALVESLNQRGERFELAQLRGIIKEDRRSTPTEIVEIIKERFASFMRFSPLKSDVVVIVLKIM